MTNAGGPERHTHKWTQWRTDAPRAIQYRLCRYLTCHIGQLRNGATFVSRRDLRRQDRDIKLDARRRR